MHWLIELRGVECLNGLGSALPCVVVVQPSGASTGVRVAWDQSWPASSSAILAMPVSRDGSSMGATQKANVTRPSQGQPGLADFWWSDTVGQAGSRPWAFALHAVTE